MRWLHDSLLAQGEAAGVSQRQATFPSLLYFRLLNISKGAFPDRDSHEVRSASVYQGGNGWESQG